MICTAAAIIAFLGYMPPKGTEIIVPRSQLTQYTRADYQRPPRDEHRNSWRLDGKHVVVDRQ